jgi:hypothetical protein
MKVLAVSVGRIAATQCAIMFELRALPHRNGRRNQRQLSDTRPHLSPGSCLWMTAPGHYHDWGLFFCVTKLTKMPLAMHVPAAWSSAKCEPAYRLELRL